MGADKSATAILRMASTFSRFRVQFAVRRFQGRGDVGQKGRKWARHGGAARDQNIVMARPAQKGQQLRRSRAQAPLGAVAGDGVADFFAGGEADAQVVGSGFGDRGGAGFEGYSAFDTADSPRRS